MELYIIERSRQAAWRVKAALRRVLYPIYIVKLKVDAICWTVFRWIGMWFRAFIIIAVGIIGYNWIDPKDLGDIPFSQQTPNMVGSNFMAPLLIVGCIWWFFSFPSEDE